MSAPKLAELLAQKAALEKRIAEAQRAERDVAIGRIKALMAEYGLTMADLTRGGAPAAPRAGRPPAASAAADGEPAPGKPSRAGRKLGKVAPKYRDPATGATWSGRGLKPKWLVAALEAGRSIDEFRL